MGATSVCVDAIGGMAGVTDAGGGNTSNHQWGYRTTSGGFVNYIQGETSTSFAIDGASFPGPGTYYLVCGTIPECGEIGVSNEIAVAVTTDAIGAPAVNAAVAINLIHSLC